METDGGLLYILEGSTGQHVNISRILSIVNILKKSFILPYLQMILINCKIDPFLKEIMKIYFYFSLAQETHLRGWRRRPAELRSSLRRTPCAALGRRPGRGAAAPPGPTVPTHVAGYLKRLLRAFKSGVPLRKLVEEMGRMVDHVSSDIVQWFEEFCMSRMISPAVESPDGCYLRQRVSLSADEIERNAAELSPELDLHQLL